MKIYVVGGAVRDTLLNLPIKDIDYVVVGATPDDMMNLGYKQVGVDFPVFLNEKGEEFALARKERKVEKGYQGFEVSFDPNISLEEDLFRRDLTINAMAVEIEKWQQFTKTKDKSLVIDPFGGLNDIKTKTIRHVSEAFAEDPVRVLRVARFVARYWIKFSFIVDRKTLKLMKDIVKSGEVDSLTPERVWIELTKAFMEDYPQKFFQILEEVGAAERIFPVLNNKNAIYSNAWISATLRNLSFEERFVLFASLLNKKDLNDELLKLKAPKNLIDDCLFFNTFYKECIKLIENNVIIDNKVLYNILKKLNAWKNEDKIKRLSKLLNYFSVPELDHIVDLLLILLTRTSVVGFSSLSLEQQKTLKGKDVGIAIEKLREEVAYGFKKL